MTTRIQRDFSFLSGGCCEELFSMCMYETVLFIDVETDSIREQNIAMERISYFMSGYLEDAIFIKETNKKMIDLYTAAGLKVCTLPEEPHEQMISIMLMLKLNAITEGRFVITDLSLTSSNSDGVTYMCDIESSLGPFAETGWWDKSDASMSAPTKPNKKDKIVQLFKTHTADWSEFGLGWKEKEITLIVEKPEITFDKLPEQL
jgi:hypothetical protein